MINEKLVKINCEKFIVSTFLRSCRLFKTGMITKIILIIYQIKVLLSSLSLFNCNSWYWWMVKLTFWIQNFAKLSPITNNKTFFCLSCERIGKFLFYFALKSNFLGCFCMVFFAVFDQRIEWKIIQSFGQTQQRRQCRSNQEKVNYCSSA